MNKLGTGTRKLKTINKVIKRKINETTYIDASAWSSSILGITASVSLSAVSCKGTVKNGVAISYTLVTMGGTDITSNISTVLFVGSFGTTLNIVLKSTASKPTQRCTFTITYTCDDTISTSKYTVDTYHRANLGSEEFNVCTPLFKGFTTDDYKVFYSGEYNLYLSVKNPYDYPLQVISAAITIDDSDQHTFYFGLSDLIFTNIQANSDFRNIFHVDMDEYSGISISSGHFDLVIGGPGIKPYRLIADY